mgnify:CR=1 FL=1
MSAFCGTATAKTECGADPTKPGACFFPANPGGGFIGCDDGLIVWPIPTEGKRSIGRVNPNGTIAVHQTAGAVPAGACQSSDYDSGICGDFERPGPGVFTGEVSLQINGFVTPDGGASCPFKLTSKGLLFRDVGNGPEEAEINAVYHLVKDKKSATGCRIAQCQVFAPNDSE